MGAYGSLGNYGGLGAYGNLGQSDTSVYGDTYLDTYGEASTPRPPDVLSPLVGSRVAIPVTVVSLRRKEVAFRGEPRWTLDGGYAVVTQGQRSSWTGSLVLAAMTGEEADDVLAILMSGHPVALLAAEHEQYGVAEVEYLSVGDVTERMVSRLALTQERTFELEVTSIDEPSYARALP